MAEDSKEHRAELKSVIGGLATDLKEVKESLGEVKIQTTKTNGGMIQLKSDVYGDDGKKGAIEILDSLKSRERYVAGALAVVFALFGIVPFFLNLYIKDSVVTAIREIESQKSVGKISNN